MVSNPPWAILYLNQIAALLVIKLIEQDFGLNIVVFKYDVEFEKEAVIKNLNRITDRIFKLLPSREEGGDWETPLQNLILEIVGMKRLWIDQPKLFSLLCKLEALQTLAEDGDFLIFRKMIFECLGILSQIKKELE